MADQNILDKSMRSVFVGNIPYEATEEKLKDIFNEVGPVISFKLVYDRETGKPKGYGFCEYKDQETALSAMRNLNGYEIGGRTLRVDNACTEKSRLEMQSLMLGMPTSESHYGDAVNSEKAPDIINNLVSTLPPEQLYELMKQMKDCVQNNPVEARNMLLQNPQLGYALLQALVVMKIVEPEAAKAMMHTAHKVPPTLQLPRSQITPQTSQMPCNNIQWKNPNTQIGPPPDVLEWHHNMNIGRDTMPDLRQPPNHLPFMPVESSQSYPGSRDFPHTTDIDTRSFGDACREFRINTNFMSVPPPMTIPPPVLLAQNTMIPPKVVNSTQPQTQKQPNQLNTSDAEKAALIMQVLQLSDSQIALLPAEQRQSIIQLKEKITLSSQKKD